MVLKLWRAYKKGQILGSIPAPKALNSPGDSDASAIFTWKVWFPKKLTWILQGGVMGMGGDQGGEREGSALKQTERHGPNLGKGREWRRCSRVLKVPRNMGGLHGRPREALRPHWLFCVQMTKPITHGNGDSCLQTNLMAINQGTWSSSQMNEKARHLP